MKVKSILFSFLICFAFWPVIRGSLNSQTTGGSRYLRIGELWTEDREIPCGGWENNLQWPGNHFRRLLPSTIAAASSTIRKVGMGFGLKNWTDWKKKYYPIVLGGVDPSVLIEPPSGRFGLISHALKVVLRRPPPALIVNGEVMPHRQDYDELDPNLISDAMLVIRWSLDVGLTCEQRYYAYASKPFDSHFYIDLTVKNTGNVNTNEKNAELPNQILHDVCFIWGFHPQVSNEGSWQEQTGYEHWNDDWVEYYGENYAKFVGNGTPAHPNGDRTADSLRLFIVWDGNSEVRSPGYDDTGDPDKNEVNVEPSPGRGNLLSAQYVGYGYLHVDKSVEDKSNDLTQPYGTVWHPGDAHFNSLEAAYNFFISPQHMLSPQEMGFTEPLDQINVSRPNGYMTIGPYEMPFNSSIHYVLLAAVNGINSDLCDSLGLSWWTHRRGSEGITDQEKNRWIATGRDSLFKYFSLATRRYFRNIENGRSPYDVPEAPLPPDLTVTAGEKSVTLDWSDVSAIPDYDTGVLDFSGYRVYRTVGRTDTTFVKIWECGGKSGVAVTTHYVDQTVQRGFAYFYYVSAYDDGTQNWEKPGQSLESGKYWNMMFKNTPVHPFMSSKPQIDLQHIKVIPNPFHDKSVKYNYPGEENKILFINLPLECTLNIYTTSGDLVRTIHHHDGTTEQAWNQITDDNQLIFSGVYFYTVESDQGNATGKFVVIRSSRTDR
jgi:hypothetical protein